MVAARGAADVVAEANAVHQFDVEVVTRRSVGKVFPAVLRRRPERRYQPDVRTVRGSIDARPPIPVGCSPETRALSAQQRSSKTGRPAAAVDADLAGGEGADVESGPAQAGIGFAIFFDGQQALVAKR